MGEGLLTLMPELLNLGVGALSLIVMYALIQLVRDVNKANAERNKKNDDTESLQAQTNLKLVENQAQLTSMFEKIDASIAFNAATTQKGNETLTRIEMDGKSQIGKLDDIKNTFSASQVASAVQAAQQPVASQIIKEHSDILIGIDDTKKAIAQSQSEILGKLATLPEDVKAVLRADIDAIAAKVTLIEELVTSLRPQLSAMQNEIIQKLPMPEIDRMPPKTETALPTLPESAL